MSRRMIVIGILSFAFIFSSAQSQENKNHINCGGDLDCFIEASRSCQPSIWTSPFDTSFELRGMRNNKCIIYNVFMEEECKKKTADVTAMLERWKAGKLSTQDWADCE